MGKDRRFRAAAIQMRSGADKQANVAAAERLVGEAAAGGAQVVALPELWNCLAPHEEMVRQAEPIPGETSEKMSDLARAHGIYLLAGSISERVELEIGPRVYNTSLLFGPGGEELARYSKVHLFDVDLENGPHVEESKWFAPGDTVRTAETPHGNWGFSICYDLRFGALYRALVGRGAEVIFVPSAFTKITGAAHWMILLRARAIECQAVVIAPNQCGLHGPDLESYGHSAIIGPWGEVLASAGEEEEVVVTAEVSLDRVDEVRRQIPVQRHRLEIE